MSHDRRYPIPPPEDDDRFTFGLVLEVADVLAGHRYPKLTSGDDFVALQQALFRFLYDTTTPTTATPTATSGADPAGLDPATEEC